MKKTFQRLHLKLQLLGIGAGAFLLPWAGVQYLETERAVRNQEKKAAMERELQLQQEIERLNQQVAAVQQPALNVPAHPRPKPVQPEAQSGNVQSPAPKTAQAVQPAPQNPNQAVQKTGVNKINTRTRAS